MSPVTEKFTSEVSGKWGNGRWDGEGEKEREGEGAGGEGDNIEH